MPTATQVTSSNGSATAGQFQDKAAQLTALIEELVRLAPQAASAKLGELKEEGQELVETGKEKAVQAARQVVDTVKRHPVETAVVAVGAGLLAWWLLTRK